MNVVQTWLYLIGTPERARYLLDNLWQCDGYRHRGCGGAVNRHKCSRCGSRLPTVLIRTESPPPDPVTILDGRDTTAMLYADPELTPAFDAWDTGQLTSWDMRHFAQWIADGRYRGPVAELLWQPETQKASA